MWLCNQKTKKSILKNTTTVKETCQIALKIFNTAIMLGFDLYEKWLKAVRWKGVEGRVEAIELWGKDKMGKKTKR